MKERLKKLAIGGAVLVGLGAAYTALILVIGRGLYCPFWKLTGLLCPGCGVTRMCLALLRLDVAAAWRANAALPGRGEGFLGAAHLLSGLGRPAQSAGLTIKKKTERTKSSPFCYV